MTDELDTRSAAAGIAPQPPTAGATLRSAREAAGLSVDDVAQQLKLAPRQVQALEEDDFQRLPGRTFARGFARNYARFVQLDPDAVLALMPASEAAPALERPSFAAARRPMGEIPVERAIRRTGAPRALMLLLVLVVVGAAAYYEYSRQGANARRESTATSSAAPAAATRALTTPGTGSTTTVLPNPVAESAPATSAAPAPAGEAAPAAPVAGTDGSAAPATGAGATTTAAAKASDPALVLTFKGTSWAEVKDASGRVILQMTGGAGMTQTVTGVPPLELALGNAPDVVVTFRGQALDLAPYTRGVVARVGLK